MRATNENINRRSNRNILPQFRPPAELIPEDLRGQIDELDRLRDQLADARQKAHALDNPDLTTEAKRTDEVAAVAAVRAGKAIPAAKAMNKLEADRDAAARALAAHESAYADAEQAVCDALGWRYDDLRESRTKRRADARERITKAAEKLADLIESECVDEPLEDWLRGATWQPTIKILPGRLPGIAKALKSHALNPDTDVPPGNVRTLLLALATAALESPLDDETFTTN